MPSDQYVEMRLLPWARPVEVLRARYTTFEFPTHAHAEFTIGEVVQGSELFAHRGKQVEAPAGWFIHLNPCEAHTGRARRGSWAYVTVYPGLEFLRSTLPELCTDGDPRFTSPVSHRPAMHGRLAAFVRRAIDGADDLELQADLFGALRDLMAPDASASRHMAGRDGTRSSAVAHVRDRLWDEWDRKLSLTELAEAASMTPLTLLRVFRHEVGCTPQIYRTTRRVTIAKELLRGGSRLTEVALRCGFTDQSHFTNTFHRWTGMTPGRYRAIARPPWRRT